MNIAEFTARMEFDIKDFTNEDISDLDLTGFDLTDKCFDGCNFENTILIDSNCSGSTFENANIRDAKTYNTTFKDPKMDSIFNNVCEETIF